MQSIQSTSSTLFHLTSLLEELAAGCDPEFDAAYDDLNREFAEARLQLGNE
jgi:hypothetical protein